MKNSLHTLVFILLAHGFALAQEFEHTLSYDISTGSPRATIENAAWIEGYWRGEAFGGVTEEIWSEPLGGAMMASFRLVNNDQVSFYELETISEVDGSLILRLKHFHGNLRGWEEKEETVDFKLVKLAENMIYFDGMTFERVSKDEMNVYVVIEDHGKKEEVRFNYRRVK